MKLSTNMVDGSLW